MTVSGVQLVTGVTVERPATTVREVQDEQLFPSQPLAIAAVVVGLAGIGLHRWLGTAGRASLGAVGMGSSLLLCAQAAWEVSGQEMPITIDLEAGYWLALLFFGGATAANGFALLEQRDRTPGASGISPEDASV